MECGCVRAAPAVMLPAVTRIDAGRLVLRGIGLDEARVLLAGARPAGLVLAPGYPSRYSIEVVQLLLDGVQLGPYGPYFMLRKSDGAVVGEIGCGVQPGSDTGEVGYSVIEPCWGQGYATEALRALLDFVLAQPGMRRVVARTTVAHRASRRVMEKAGMRYTGRCEGTEDGRPVTLVSYETVTPQ